MSVQLSTIEIGDLRERITVQRAVETPDGAGGATRAWADLATRWASVLPTGGREALTTPGLQAVQGYRITVRHGLGVVPEDRIVWKGITMNVRSAADPDGRKFWTVIFADAGVVTD